MRISFEKSKQLQERASRVLPLGVNSNFRYWGEGITPYVQRAQGAYLWDVDGNRYIDYRLAFGPIILGHAYPEVNAKVHEEIDKGVLFAMTGELEVEVAEKISRHVPGRRDGPPGLLGHRSHHARHPRGARLHRPRAGP